MKYYRTSTASEGDWQLSTHADPTSTRRAPILGFWGTKFSKMGDSLLRTPMNLRAKFDAASFILAGDIRNSTNTKS